jgi:hypothetical protein
MHTYTHMNTSSLSPHQHEGKHENLINCYSFWYGSLFSNIAAVARGRYLYNFTESTEMKCCRKGEKMGNRSWRKQAESLNK